MKNFEEWKYEEVERTFGIRRVTQIALFDQWMQGDSSLLPETAALLEGLRAKLEERADAWNEDELKMFFRNWFFLLLEDQSYCKSRAFVASNQEITTIFSILAKGKALMVDLAKKVPPAAPKTPVSTPPRKRKSAA